MDQAPTMNQWAWPWRWTSLGGLAISSEIDIGDGLAARATGQRDPVGPIWAARSSVCDPASLGLSHGWNSHRRSRSTHFQKAFQTERTVWSLFKVLRVNSVLPWQLYRPIVALCEEKGGFGEFVVNQGKEALFNRRWCGVTVTRTEEQQTIKLNKKLCDVHFNGYMEDYQPTSSDLHGDLCLFELTFLFFEQSIGVLFSLRI